MALRISRTNQQLLQDMVLAHRVAVREKAQSNRDTDSEYWDKMAAERITQYALDVALGDDADHKTQHLLDQRERGSDDAGVALIRLKWLGVTAAD